MISQVDHDGFTERDGGKVRAFRTTLRDSQPEAFSDGVFLTADEGAAARSNSTAQLIETGSKPRL